MLTRDAILEAMRKGDIIISPFKMEQLNPNSYNVTLNDKLLVYDCFVIDMKKDNPTKEITIPKEGFIMKPNILYLGRTNEYTETYNLVPGIDGRSSIGRLGLAIHATAGFGDTGFKGTWTLELYCVQPVKIYPNTPIGQLYFNPITGKPTNYSGRYNGQIDPTASRFYKDYEKNTPTKSSETELKM